MLGTPKNGLIIPLQCCSSQHGHINLNNPAIYNQPNEMILAAGRSFEDLLDPPDRT